MTQHDDLERLLQKRAATPPAGDLAERIIAAALRMPQKQPFKLLDWVNAMSADLLHVARPAYAFASVLALGFVVGLSAAEPATANTLSFNDVSHVLNGEETAL